MSVCVPTWVQNDFFCTRPGQQETQIGTWAVDNLVVDPSYCTSMCLVGHRWKIAMEARSLTRNLYLAVYTLSGTLLSNSDPG